MKTNQSKILNYITVFITGMSVMFLEILGTRVIGPYYGVSLFVWSSLISVALVSLSAGYYLGGILVDKERPKLSLFLIIGIAASFIAIIPTIDSVILELTNSLGIRFGALCSAFLLFAIPLTLLGMVGPYIIKARAIELEKVATTSGSVFAISTIGSFLGTLIIGFLLLPLLGTQNIIYIISAVLFLLSIIIMIKEGLAFTSIRVSSAIVNIVICVSIISVSFISSKLSHSNSEKNFDVVYESESLYGKVKVIEDHRWDVRWLMSDSSTIGGQFIKSSTPLFPFLQMLDYGHLFNPTSKKALLIGLGAGYLPMALKKHNIITDVIEIDPKVASAAQDYFGFVPPGTLDIGDARFHIRNIEGKYDYIVHDTFTGGSVPCHLLSLEMIQDVETLLNDGGVLALVYYGFSKGSESIAASSVYKTINSLFPFMKVYVSKKNTEPVDILFFASKSPLELPFSKKGVHKNPVIQKVLRKMQKNEIEIQTDRGFVITDDYNPLDSLQSRKAEAYRQKVIELIGSEMLLE